MEAAFCKTCNQNKPIDLFPKGGTILYKCKSCIAERHRTKVVCEIPIYEGSNFIGLCGELISYGNMNKHMFKHNGIQRSSKVVCDCGAVIKEYCRYYHNRTKRHLREIEILNS